MMKTYLFTVDIIIINKQVFIFEKLLLKDNIIESSNIIHRPILEFKTMNTIRDITKNF